MNTATVEVPLGHLVITAELLNKMSGILVPVSRIRSGLALEAHPHGCIPETYTIEVTKRGDIVTHVCNENHHNEVTVQSDHQVTARVPIPGVIVPPVGDPYVGVAAPGDPVQLGTIWDGGDELIRRWELLVDRQHDQWRHAQRRITPAK